MIERLKAIDPYDETEIDMDVNSVAGLVYENTPLIQKVNELVDAVNEMQATISKMENVAENGNFAKNAQAPYAEQRLWIGKLCKFWDDDAFVTSNDWAFGILTSIDKGMQFQYCCNENCNFKHCEPVKPDDDIIYKGDDNE